MKENKGITGDPKWNGSGGLWLNHSEHGPRWKGQVQIDGVIYSLEGHGTDQQKSSSPAAPTIKLKATVREMY